MSWTRVMAGYNKEEQAKLIREEQRIKDEELKRRHPKTWKLAREWVEYNKVDISNQIKKSITG